MQKYRIKFFVKKIIPPFLLEKIRNYRNKILEKTLYFQIHLTYHCNLKCKGCSHFSSIAEEENLDINSYENDLKRLSLLGERLVRQIDLLGGEPLLHPHINHFLIIARKYFKKTKIVLVTNGILLPKMTDDFWKTCSEKNIFIIISYYPISIAFDIIEQKASKFGVELSYDINAKGRIFGHFKLDSGGNQNEEENVKLCYESKNCHCLDKGKMFLCYMPACIDIFNKQFNENIQICEKDYIDIYKIKNISEITNYLKRPMLFCKYCNVKNRVGAEWGISKKAIEEWT